MKILFVTDLHGNLSKYKRLHGIAKFHGVEMVINGGDMLPKDGDLFEQDQFITGVFTDHLEQFNASKIHYLCCLGNDDLRIFDPLFEETCQPFPFVHNIAQRKVEIGGYEFIGMNWVVDYPFRLKDRCRMDTKDYVFQEQFGSGLYSTPNGWEEIKDWVTCAQSLPTIEEELQNLPKPKNVSKSIYAIHMPPARLGLDKCAHGAEVGSQAVYNFIETNKPLLTLHGHIHESPRETGIWTATLGKTICIQPGQLAPLSYVVVDLATMQHERMVT